MPDDQVRIDEVGVSWQWQTEVGRLTLKIDQGIIWCHHPRRTWLAQLRPSEVHQEGAFGHVWPWQVNRNLYGGPLSLNQQVVESVSSCTVRARLTWPIPEGATHFSATIGIDDVVAPEGDCEVQILADDQILWSGRLRGIDAPEKLMLSVDDAHQMTINIALGERYDIGDHVVLGNAWFLRSP